MPVVKQIFKYLLAAALILGGINHFVMPEFYLRIMPPYLPAPLFLIYLSGVFETAFGVLLLIGRTTRLAAWGIIALLVAVYPANIYMATNPDLFPAISPLILYLRLPLQIVLIGWAYWLTREPR